MKKVPKQKNGRIKNKRQQNIDLWLKPYIKNGIFEKKLLE